MQLHEVSAIGEPYNLSLPERAKALCALPQPLPVRFTVLEEKFLGRTAHEGRLMAVSDDEGGMESEFAPAALSNLKIEIGPGGANSPGGEIYAKVIADAPGAPHQTRVRFTSITPELKVWVQQMSARLVAGAPAETR